MGKFLLVIIIFILIFLLAVGVFIRKLMKLFGISRSPNIQNNTQKEKRVGKSQEILFKDGDTTVLRGEAKKNDTEE